ncbi:autoinducer 2 sensor kinase/phosphatase LuxQ [bacterium BMS3Abin04]|nr:autoinducer 2 sensor kinase/phosphatase LuxQ [bacterium BMS3Abin04]
MNTTANKIAKHKYRGWRNMDNSGLNNLFTSIFESADIAKCIINSDGIIVDANRLFCKMLGYTHKELLGLHYFILIPSDSREKSKEFHNKILSDEQILKFEEKLRRRNGTHFYAFTTNIKVSDEEGNLFRVVSIEDISDRMKNELLQSVLLSISKEATFSNSPDTMYALIHESISQIIPITNIDVFLLDDGKELVKKYSNYKLNNEWLTVYFANYSLDKKESLLLDKKELKNILIENNHLFKSDKLPESFLGIPLKTKTDIEGIITLQSFDRKYKYSENDKALLELISDQVARVIERKNNELALKKAKEEAEEASKLKSQFLAQISHEVRTPLNSILSFTSLIESELKGKLSNDLKDSFEIINNGGERLRRTIELLLNASQLQNGKYKIHIEEVDLVKYVLLPIVKQFSLQAKEKGLKLEFDNKLGNSNVVCDVYTTGQIFINIIDNAIKYTKHGKIIVKAFKNNFGKVQVDVTDTGIGISEDYLPNIFETFSQEETGYTRRYEGMGLGLALVKEYAALNNIEVSVESKKGKGTKFSIVFN